MRIDIISVVPDILKSPFEASILKRAIEKGHVEIHFHDLRDYVTDNYRQIDDYQFGGGAGMVMMIEPLYQALQSIKKRKAYKIILLSPLGKLFNQVRAKKYSKLDMSVCAKPKPNTKQQHNKKFLAFITLGFY